MGSLDKEDFGIEEVTLSTQKRFVNWVALPSYLSQISHMMLEFLEAWKVLV